MHQEKINAAITECVRYSMGADQPLKSLQRWYDLRAAEGWSKAELNIVRQAAIKMLSGIYGLDQPDEFRCGVCGEKEFTDNGLPPIGWKMKYPVQYSDGSETTVDLCPAC